jgi:hypothetical protein
MAEPLLTCPLRNAQTIRERAVGVTKSVQTAALVPIVLVKQ